MVVMPRVSFASRTAMYRELHELIDSPRVTDFDPETIPTDLTESDADAFARALEAIRNLTER